MIQEHTSMTLLQKSQETHSQYLQQIHNAGLVADWDMDAKGFWSIKGGSHYHQVGTMRLFEHPFWIGQEPAPQPASLDADTTLPHTWHLICYTGYSQSSRLYYPSFEQALTQLVETYRSLGFL